MPGERSSDLPRYQNVPVQPAEISVTIFPGDAAACPHKVAHELSNLYARVNTLEGSLLELKSPTSATTSQSNQSGGCIEFPPANCRQRLKLEGKPYPKSGCYWCGRLLPLLPLCNSALVTEKPPSLAEKGEKALDGVIGAFKMLCPGATVDGEHIQTLAAALQRLKELETTN